MKFLERIALAKQGKKVLRVMKNASDSYHVAYQTEKGGWAMLNKNWTQSNKQFCETAVDELVKMNPKLYFKDEDL